MSSSQDMEDRRAETAKLLATMRNVLTRQQRIVCAAYWFDGLSQEAIGRRFRKGQPAVSQMISRACRALREHGIEPPTDRPKIRRYRVGSLSDHSADVV